MAKQRASLPLPRVSSGGSSTTSSSAASCIDVAGTRESTSSFSSALLPTVSTPPTSVSEGDSNEIPADAKDTVGAIEATEAIRAAEVSEMTRRSSSRRKSGPATYNLGVLSGVGRTSAGKSTKEKPDRSFSGETLVDKPSGSTPNSPQRQMMDEAHKALDMDWQIDALPGDIPSDLPPRKKRRNRSSMDLLVEKTGRAVDRVKSVLGKRDRDTDDPVNTGRRQSRRLAEIQKSPVKDDEKADEEPEKIERPNRLSRLSSSFSLNLPSVFGSLNKPAEKTTTKPVKRYQSHGLYAGQAIDDSAIPEENKSRRKSSKPRPMSASFATDMKNAKRSSTISLPMFSYLEGERPFTIPFDIFAPHHHARGEEKPKDWGKVHKNRLIGDAKEIWKKPKFEQSRCQCEPQPPGSSEDGCGDGCHNRAMDYECDDDNCKLGDQCTNRDFAELAARTERANKSDKKSASHLYNAGVEVVKTQDRGFGVRACRSYRPNQIITEYTGEIITPDEAGRRIREDYKNKADYYQMEFDQGMILDATRGSIARFVNHACEPNCKMIKKFVAGQPRMALFAGDDGIMTGEELTYDYNFDPYSVKNVQECRCGSANCRGVLGPRPKDANKPTTKKEKEGMAAGMARKASELLGAAPADGVDKALFKKRKVPQMSKGWVYVDETMEQTRLEEAAKDREIARLQKEGILPENLDIKKSTSSTTITKDKNGAKRFVQKITTKLTGHKPKATPQAPSKKPGMLRRVSSPVKNKPSPRAPIDKAGGSRVTKQGRRSLDSRSTASRKVRPVTAEGAKMGRTLRVVQADD